MGWRKESGEAKRSQAKGRPRDEERGGKGRGAKGRRILKKKAEGKKKREKGRNFASSR